MKDVRERLKEYGKSCPVMPDEGRVRDAAWRSRKVFFEEAEKYPASYVDFFCGQVGYIRKRWWVFQILALMVLWWCIRNLSRRTDLQCVMGVMAAVFAIMLIPELWKSKAAGAMEVEGSTFYSLRQIYAVRMLAFGLVDVGFLSVFTVIASATTSIQGKEIIIYFFLPFTVTCSILFRTLCSRFMMSQTGAVVSSLLWITVWLFTVTNEQIYQSISVPVWMVLLLAAVLYLCYAVKRTLVVCESIWEVGM